MFKASLALLGLALIPTALIVPVPSRQADWRLDLARFSAKEDALSSWLRRVAPPAAAATEVQATVAAPCAATTIEPAMKTAPSSLRAATPSVRPIPLVVPQPPAAGGVLPPSGNVDTLEAASPEPEPPAARDTPASAGDIAPLPPIERDSAAFRVGAGQRTHASAWLDLQLDSR